MSAVKSFRELRVYRATREQSRILFDLTRHFPKEEQYALTNQIRRSSRAVCALIAEAWGRRRYPAEFSNKLSQAKGEADETLAWLDVALDCGYLLDDQHQELNKHWQRIGGMLRRTMQNAESFCKSSPRR